MNILKECIEFTVKFKICFQSLILRYQQQCVVLIKRGNSGDTHIVIVQFYLFLFFLVRF